MRRPEWGFFGWIFGIPFAFGLAMLTTSPPHFLASEISFGISGLVALVWWLKSKTLAGLKPHVRLGDMPNFHNKVVYELWKLGMCFCVVLVTVFAIIMVKIDQHSWELTNLSEGWLIPNNLPSPSAPCTQIDENHQVKVGVPLRLPPGAIAIYFGSNVAWTTRFPMTIVQVADDPKLVIDRNEKGEIALTGTIWDSSNPAKFIVKVEKNHVLRNGNNAAEFQRSDSDLRIVDQQTNVLEIKYLNKQAFEFSGTLYYPEFKGSPLVISSTDLIFGNRKVYHECYENMSTPAISIYPRHKWSGAMVIAEN